MMNNEENERLSNDQTASLVESTDTRVGDETTVPRKRIGGAAKNEKIVSCVIVGLSIVVAVGISLVLYTSSAIGSLSDGGGSEKEVVDLIFYLTNLTNGLLLTIVVTILATVGGMMLFPSMRRRISHMLTFAGSLFALIPTLIEWRFLQFWHELYDATQKMDNVRLANFDEAGFLQVARSIAFAGMVGRVAIAVLIVAFIAHFVQPKAK